MDASRAVVILMQIRLTKWRSKLVTAAALLALSPGTATAQTVAVPHPAGNALPLGRIDFPVVFVSRQIPDRGSIYWDVPNDMPGVGPHSRSV